MVKPATSSKSPLIFSLSTNQSSPGKSDLCKQTKPKKTKLSVDKTIPKKQSTYKKISATKTKKLSMKTSKSEKNLVSKKKSIDTRNTIDTQAFSDELGKAVHVQYRLLINQILGKKQEIIIAQNDLANTYKANDILISELNYITESNFVKDKADQIERDITCKQIFCEEIQTKILNVQEYLTEAQAKICKKDSEMQDLIGELNETKNQLDEKNAEKNRLIENYGKLKVIKTEL